MAVAQDSVATPGEQQDVITKLNLYFKSVVDMIPSDAYFTKITDANKRHKKDKDIDAEDKIPASQVKAMVKRRKLNPKLMKSTSQMMEMESSEEEEDTAPPQKKKIIKKEGSGDDPSSITDLQKKLQERISDIKSQRNSKNRTPEEQEAIRIRRKQERKRYKQKKMQKQIKLKGDEKETAQVEKTLVKKEEKKPVRDKNGKVVFSKFDFGQADEKEKKNKKKKDLPTGKNYEVLLNKVKVKKENLEKLKEENPAKASEVVAKEGWSNAMAKAEGIKLKDDPALLKKSIKRKQSIKNQSAKKWKEREDKVKEQMDKRQEKRKNNIDKKRDRKKNLSKGKKGKKGAPGF
uniref:surfeit locus protein 6 homolog n=1 Tax=Ciona intestinalis TaxID=7719 RepID=UPI000180C204|nr:surfeit locus protein 6 homolog [Ciona intestinalis]|eukprot:XP_018667545.1 surfeit locus protein 6 homolog [Ciona intestinalis]